MVCGGRHLLFVVVIQEPSRHCSTQLPAWFFEPLLVLVDNKWRTDICQNRFQHQFTTSLGTDYQRVCFCFSCTERFDVILHDAPLVHDPCLAIPLPGNADNACSCRVSVTSGSDCWLVHRVPASAGVYGFPRHIWRWTTRGRKDISAPPCLDSLNELACEMRKFSDCDPP